MRQENIRQNLSDRKVSRHLKLICFCFQICPLLWGNIQWNSKNWNLFLCFPSFCLSSFYHSNLDSYSIFLPWVRPRHRIVNFVFSFVLVNIGMFYCLKSGIWKTLKFSIAIFFSESISVQTYNFVETNTLICKSRLT